MIRGQKRKWTAYHFGGTVSRMITFSDDSLEDADELPEPQDLAADAITELEEVVEDLREIVALLEKEEGLTTDDADDTDRKRPGRKSSGEFAAKLRP
jgi:hypothetical protein